MNNKANLTQYCSYYKGEKANPFEGRSAEKSAFWNYERFWADTKMADDGEHVTPIDAMVDDYIRDGLRTFEQYDNVPLSLKAVLYNRYLQWNETPPDGFKQWYINKYRKGSK